MARTKPGPVEGPNQDDVPQPANVGMDTTNDTEVVDDSPKETVVRYIHEYVFQARALTVQDLRNLGVDPEDKDVREIRWGPENNWTVRRADMAFLTDEQFDAAIRRDDKFVVEEV